MDTTTILCVTDDTTANGSVLEALRDAGYEVLVASSAAQAAALLFIHRRIEAVVLDQRLKDRASIRLVRLLRSLRSDVPILLLSRDVLDPLPRCIDACVCVGQELGSLLPILHTMVLGKRGFNLDLYGTDEVTPGLRS